MTDHEKLLVALVAAGDDAHSDVFTAIEVLARLRVSGREHSGAGGARTAARAPAPRPDLQLQQVT